MQIRDVILLLRSKKDLTNNLIGLDFGTELIKLLKINSSTTPFCVENYATIPMPTGFAIKDGAKAYAAIGYVLSDLVKTADIKSPMISLAIPRSSAIIKNIGIDMRLKASEIEARVWTEANRHFPDLVGEIYLDYDILGPMADDPKLLEVMYVACRKDEIKPYLEILRMAGLTPKIIDVNCYALERSLRLIVKKETQTVALLNLDLTLSSLILLDNDRLVFAHDQSYDGKKLMAQIQKYVADTNKQGALDDPAYLTILKDNLSIHLRHSMHFFYSSRPNINIQKIVLAGDLALIPCLGEFIQQEVGIDTVIANPFSDMTVSKQVDEKKLLANAPTLMLCAGLALGKARQLNEVKIIKSVQQT